METKRTVTFVDRLETQDYKYEVSEIPRVGEHVTIFDNPKSAKILLQGTVIRVRWVYIDSERDLIPEPTIVLDAPPV